MTKTKLIDSPLVNAHDHVEKVTTMNATATRRPYQAPELMHYGDVRDITMGPTVGFGESGGGPFCAEGVNCPS